MSNDQVLASMLSAAPGQSAAVASSISSVEDIISNLTDESTALQGSLTDVAETDAIDIIENTILPLYSGGYVVYGTGFGTIEYGVGNISAWSIWADIDQPQPLPPLPPVLPVPTLQYPYTPGDYPELDELVADYAFGNDYLTRPLTGGATYGIIPNITSMGLAKSTLEENKSILDQSINVLAKYV